MRTNYAQFATAYLIVRVAILVFLAVIYFIILLWIRGIRLNPSAVFPAIIGVLFIVLGLTMDKIRPNWFVGIRTPWTLTSERSWRETHRLGKWLFLLVGLVFLISGLGSGLGASSITLFFWVGMVFLFAIILFFLIIYSYFIWRADPERGSSETRHS
jgi:uncharacterized membrane protein